MHTGLIGTGHLGRALVRQFLDAKVLYPGEVMVSNRTRIKAEALAREMGTAVGGNREVAEACEVIFLCVRPIQVKEVLGELQDLLTSEKLLISTAVDFSNAQISRIVSARLARVIPSICSTTKRGITLVSFHQSAKEEDRNKLYTLFRPLGEVVEAKETDLEILADLTSCAPAYISALLQELATAAARKGVSPKMADSLIKETLAGTSRLLEMESFQGLIDQVATPGGITEEGVKVIRDDVPRLFDRLLDATRAKHVMVQQTAARQR